MQNRHDPPPRPNTDDTQDKKDRDTYAAITARFLEQMRAGVLPWKKPWAVLPPQNLFSRRAYRGINVWTLHLQGYESPFWATFKQVKTNGGFVRKGETSTPVILWKWVRKMQKSEAGEEETVEYAYTRLFHVFNFAQTEGLTAPEITERMHSPLAACEAIVRGMPDPPTIRQGGSRAFYRPATDEVQIPPLGSFTTPEAFHATLFHELVHSTGHPQRLARPTLAQLAAFGDESYSREELIAELGSAFLCHTAGIETAETFQNSAAYLQGWMKALESDEKLLIHAAQAAQKAVDYVLNQRRTEDEA